MKKIVFICVLSAMGLFSFAQNSEPAEIANKSFFAELGGPGILFSANIDTRFKKSPLGFGGRIGVGFLSVDDFTTSGYYARRSVFTLPVQLNYIFGKANSVHAFEVGAGATFTSKKIDIIYFYDGNNSTGTNVMATASFMYRRLPHEGGFSWRIGFVPIFASENIFPSGAVSVGYNF